LKWKWSAFSATGEHVVSYSSTDAAALRGKAATFTFETSVAKPDGTKDTWRGDLTVTVGKDRWRQIFTNQTCNGEKQPDEEYTYERREKR
jgi:hypothetical protein